MEFFEVCESMRNQTLYYHSLKSTYYVLLASPTFGGLHKNVVSLLANSHSLIFFNFLIYCASVSI